MAGAVVATPNPPALLTSSCLASLVTPLVTSLVSCLVRSLVRSSWRGLRVWLSLLVPLVGLVSLVTPRWAEVSVIKAVLAGQPVLHLW